jgi:hypothetical protein
LMCCKEPKTQSGTPDRIRTCINPLRFNGLEDRTDTEAYSNMVRVEGVEPPRFLAGT